MGVFLFSLASIHWASFGFLGLGALLTVGGLVFTVRRIAFPRFLELGQDAVLLPTGLLQRRTTKIYYADIEWIQEGMIQRSPQLSIGANGRTFEFNPFMLGTADFFAVIHFLNSLPAPKEKAISRQNQPIERGKYCFLCSHKGNGKIYDSRGEIVWLVQTPRFNHRRLFRLGFCRLPDFVVYDKTDKELIRIKCERRLPGARFVMLEDGAPVCRIRQRSILLNKYRMDFAGQPKWTFHMPLFTGNFKGNSEGGARIQVHLQTHYQWYVFIDSDADSLRLVAALAFIHRERLRYI
jgi:hypothetical protein